MQPRAFKSSGISQLRVARDGSLLPEWLAYMRTVRIYICETGVILVALGFDFDLNR